MPTALLYRLPDWLDKGLNASLSKQGYAIISISAEDDLPPTDVNGIRQLIHVAAEPLAVLVNHSIVRTNIGDTGRKYLNFAPVGLYRAAIDAMQKQGYGRIVSTFGSGALTVPLLKQLNMEVREACRGANILMNAMSVNEERFIAHQIEQARAQRLDMASWLCTVKGQRPHHRFFRGHQINGGRSAPTYS